MKMKFPALALMAAALTAVPAMAQTDSNVTDTASCDGAAQCTSAPKCDKGAMVARVNPFDGLNLNAQQQQAVKALQAECQQARAEKRKGEKADTARADRQKQSPDQRIAERKAARTSYLAKVKAILTPDQYTQYLENLYVNALPAGKGARAGHPGAKKGDVAQNECCGRDGKAMKNGERRQRLERAARQAAADAANTAGTTL